MIPSNCNSHSQNPGTTHHPVVNVPGTDRWYVAYHRHAIPCGSGYKRQNCLVRMEFSGDGSIKPMDPMTTPFEAGDVGEPIVEGKGPAWEVFEKPRRLVAEALPQT